MSTGLAYPKPRPAKADRAERRKAQQARDRRENAKVTARSGGRCEVVFQMPDWKREAIWFAQTGEHPGNRCICRAVHVHHKLGGIGVRGRGASALAANKLHVCAQCHADIHAHVLVPDGHYFRRVR